MANNTLIITFFAIPQNNSSIVVNVQYPGGGAVTNYPITFLTTNAGYPHVIINNTIYNCCADYCFSFRFNYNFKAVATLLPNGNAIATITFDTGQTVGDILAPNITGNSFCSYELFDISTSTPIIVSPYTGNAWTLDNKEFEINTQNNNTYVEITSTISYPLATQVRPDITIVDKIAIRNKKSYINYGRRIHQYLKDPVPIQPMPNICTIANLSLTATERFISNNLVVNTHVLDPVKFIAGRNFVSNGANSHLLLVTNKNMMRITKKSLAAIYFYIPNGFYNLIGTINDLPYSNNFVNGNGNLNYSINESFSARKIGDVISYYLAPSANLRDTTLVRSLLVFPDGLYSNNLRFVNEYKCIDYFECTGAYSIKTEIDYISQNIMLNYVEIMQILDTKKTLKLTIDTGWCLKTDSITIDSLMSSKNVCIYIDNKPVFLRPISKSLPTLNSENENVSFTLEFQINRTSNEETYSF